MAQGSLKSEGVFAKWFINAPIKIIIISISIHAAKQFLCMKKSIKFCHIKETEIYCLFIFVNKSGWLAAGTLFTTRAFSIPGAKLRNYSKILRRALSCADILIIKTNESLRVRTKRGSRELLLLLLGVREYIYYTHYDAQRGTALGNLFLWCEMR